MTTTSAISEMYENGGLLSISDEEFTRISALVHEQFGIYLPENKKLLVQGRLNKELKRRGYTSFTKYVQDVEERNSPEELLVLVDKLSTNHSFFFREAAHFDFLSEVVLPELERAGVQPSGIRIWSAGAAVGQEAYTAAMVLHEHFGSRANWNRPVILATDISTSSLATAAEGVYPESVMEDIPEAFTRYFENAGNEQVRLSDQIRKMVLFKRLNLNQSDYPFRNKFHIVFCRNVMIYFNRETRKEMVRRFHRYTERGGYLIVGHSETLGREPEGFRYVRPTVYRK